MFKKLGMALLALLIITPLCFAAPAPSNSTDDTSVAEGTGNKPRVEKAKKKVKKQKRTVTKAKRKVVKKEKDQKDQTQK